MPPSAILYISPISPHNRPTRTSNRPVPSSARHSSHDHTHRHGTTLEQLLAALSAPRPAFSTRSHQNSVGGAPTSAGQNQNAAVLRVPKKRFAPAVDVKVEGDVMMVECDVPGIHKKNLNVELSKKHLRITGKRPRPEDDEDEREERSWLQRERRWGKFSKSIDLPEGSNPTPEGISARLRSGILYVEVELHKRQRVEGQQPQAAGPSV